ncbi:MAG: acetyl-CoA carboxylase biotin carboxyl carrier protein subunit [Prolixibacteraceae bacterium]|jgi:biotin carboxyl carrier protein|nr:acetyl-CoA carboxylase biotin carboxyl carrier protein subunit [Prolixibacteraceae bacterium]
MENTDEKDYGEYPTLSISSGLYKTELTKSFRERKMWEIPNPKIIKSVIPGTILDVFVRPGQEVKKGEMLLILEAMKMQNQITMPFDGKIKKVNVKPDEVVKKKYVMIEIQ